MDLFDNPVFCGLAVLFTILFLLNMRSFLKIVPSLWDCVVRWKGSLDLEDSIQLSRSRNWIAAILFIPLCMVVYSHGLYEPDIASGLQPHAAPGSGHRSLGLLPPPQGIPELAAGDAQLQVQDLHSRQPFVLQLCDNPFRPAFPCRRTPEGILL